MKKIFKTLMISLVLLTNLTLNAQSPNKPKTTITLPSVLPGLDLPAAVTHNGADKVNYVRSFNFYAPFTNMPEDPLTGPQNFTEAINSGNIKQATQYFDGLGRPIQTVARQASGGGKDVISFSVYDQYGRQVFQPMPYVQTGTDDGRLQLTPSVDQSSFLNGHYTGEEIFFGKTEYEASPLNRVMKQMAPGNSWAGNEVGISLEYLTNTTDDGVRIWTLGTNPATTEVYQNGKLSVTATTDENGNQVKEYTNKRGQIILKKVQSESNAGDGHDKWLNTYYLYDDFGNLRYVLPPRAVELISDNWVWTAAEMKDLVFTYTYDHRNRMVTKQVPGAGLVKMVYDQLDRLVLTQDRNQYDHNQWTFTKYDVLNRPVLTGFITSSNNHSQMQFATDNWTGQMYVKHEGLSTAGVVEGASITTSVRDTEVDVYRHKNTGYIDYLPGFVSVTDDDFVTETVSSLSHEYTVYEGYHDATFPLLADNTMTFEVNTVNFYDDYDFTTNTWSSDFINFHSAGTQNAVIPTPFYNLNGVATGSKVRILGTDDFLTTSMFYDDRGRVIQTQGKNHLGGTDISTMQYDFAGKVLNTYTVHNNPQASANNSTSILKRFTYDQTGRLLTVQEKLNNASSLKTLVSNSYNALGELESKILGDDLESLDYDYNIRGWLKSINGGYVADPNDPNEDHHFFGMDLSYDYGFEKNQLNGNIAGIKWRSKSSTKQRAYGFDYDKINRLTTADYHQNDGVANAWSQTTADFSTSYDYDANGNILNLMRKGVVAGTITTIDQLSYDYGSTFGLASNGNRLLSVKDTEGDLGQGDFKDGVNTGPDYYYDRNGNMTRDRNKGINANDGIKYNHLNLPDTITFTGNRTIVYAYDAAGIKLSKTVNDNGELTTTDYAGGFIYQDNALQHFAHEEGRVRLESGTPKYDYFIKDHLGNTRMTLTEEQETTTYKATMEVGTNTSGEVVDAHEESVFLYVDQVRDNSVTLANTTDVPGINDEYTARLNGDETGRTVGPAKMMVVNPGDQVNVSVDYYHGGTYVDNGAQLKTNMIAAIAGLFGGASTGSIQEVAVFDQFDDQYASAAAYVGTRGDAAKPRAYLNVVVFDKDFNLVSTGSAFKQTQSASGYDSLSHNITLAQGGYVYVYLSNESQTDFDVHFDNLEIAHTNGTILQEDHYYPFGLSINALSSSTPLSKPNKFKYNGFEEQTEFDLNWYDYQARFYDPQLGRFMQVDPAADFMRRHSVYNYAFDNPIRFIDPDGMAPSGVNGSCPEGSDCDKAIDAKVAVDEFVAKVGDEIDEVITDVGDALSGGVDAIGNGLNRLGSWISRQLEPGEGSQPSGNQITVEGASGTGSNTTAEDGGQGEIDVTGLFTLISGGKKMGGSPPSFTWEAGAAAADKVKKIIAMLEGDGASGGASGGASEEPNTIQRVREQRNGSFVIVNLPVVEGQIGNVPDTLFRRSTILKRAKANGSGVVESQRTEDDKYRNGN